MRWRFRPVSGSPAPRLRSALSLPEVLTFLAIVALAVARLDAAVVLGLALTSIVLVEPAPADVVLVVVIAVATVTGRFRAACVPPIVLGALGALLTLNLLSAVEVVDATRAAVYLSITAYLIVLAVWLSGYVASFRTARLVTGAYAFAAVGSAALGALAFFVGIPGSELLVEGGRVQAFFQDPNVFGPFLVPVALILTEDIMTPRLFGLRRLAKVSARAAARPRRDALLLTRRVDQLDPRGRDRPRRARAAPWRR